MRKRDAASRIVQNLLTFARQHKPERTPTSVNQVLDDTLELRGYELRVRGIDVQRDYDEQSPRPWRMRTNCSRCS